MDIYRDGLTGAMRIVSRVVFPGEGAAAIETQIDAHLHGVLAIEEEIERAREAADPVARDAARGRLVTPHLEPLERIVGGAGAASARAHMVHGLALRVHGRVEEAVASFRRAHALDPKSVGALLELVNCLLYLGQPDEAMPFARAAVEARAAVYQALGNLALCRQRTGDDVGARDALRTALALEPDHPRLLSTAASLGLEPESWP